MKHIAITALIFCFANSAFGAGYQLRYQGAESMGTAFSSAGSYGTSLSSIYYNPALFLLQDKDHAVALELMVLHPTKGEFTSAGGQVTDDYSSTSLSGGFYFGYKVDEDTAFTIAVTTPWGTKSEYDKTFDGRYHAMTTDLAAINIQPMITKKVSDKFMFSVGPQIQYMTGTLSAATFTLVPPIAGGPDLYTEFDGDSLDIGGVLALTYLMSEETTFAFNYTSRIKHNLRGDVDFTPTSVATLAGAANSDQASAELTTPDVFTLSASHAMSEKLMGHLSLGYTNWSVFKTLQLNVSGFPISVVPQNWDDTYMVALGSTYNMSEKTVLRGGLSYETGAVDNQFRTPRSQDTDRVGLGLGASFALGAVNLDLALNHIVYLGDIDLDIAADLGSGKPAAKGSYDLSSTLLRVGVEYIF